MLELVAPSTLRHDAWLAAHREWGPGLHEDGFGVATDDDVETPDGFAAWVARIEALPVARLWWVVEGGAVLGGVALRPVDNDVTRRLGHVGYGVTPSARGRGVATWALGEVLGHARSAGLERVRLVCRDDNPGSVRTIERNGGVLEEVVDRADGRRRHYGIELTARAQRHTAR